MFDIQVEILAQTCTDMSPDGNTEVSTPKGTESDHQATQLAKLYLALTKVVKVSCDKRNCILSIC